MSVVLVAVMVAVPIGSMVVPFLGLPYRIPNMNHKQELPWSLVRVVMDGSRLPESRLTVRDSGKRVPLMPCRIIRMLYANSLKPLADIFCSTLKFCRFLLSSTSSNTDT